METTASDVAGEDLKLFKSYYVVWKHYFACCIFTPLAQFKSYYVVWKPQKNLEEKRKADEV